MDMVIEGSKTNYAHSLARLIESKYGKVIELPQVLG